MNSCKISHELYGNEICPSLINKEGKNYCQLLITGIPRELNNIPSGKIGIPIIKSQILAGECCDTIKNTIKEKKLRKLAKRLEAGLKSGFFEEDGTQAVLDRTFIFDKCNEYQETKNLTYTEAITQARIELIENILKE